jgi:hypothetical protein
LKHWEIIADNLKKPGFSMGWISALDSEGRTIWIVDAYGYGKRFIVRADEILTAFLELQRGDTRVRGGFGRVKPQKLTGFLQLDRRYIALGKLP